MKHKCNSNSTICMEMMRTVLWEWDIVWQLKMDNAYKFMMAYSISLRSNHRRSWNFRILLTRVWINSWMLLIVKKEGFSIRLGTNINRIHTQRTRITTIRHQLIPSRTNIIINQATIKSSLVIISMATISMRRMIRHRSFIRSSCQPTWAHSTTPRPTRKTDCSPSATSSTRRAPTWHRVLSALRPLPSGCRTTGRGISI